MADVLLLAPPLGFESPYPLRLASVAAVLREAGADVQGIDARRTQTPLGESLQAFDTEPPRLVVIETSLRNLRATRDAVRTVKKRFGCRVVVCGTAAALDPGAFVGPDGADEVLLGDEESAVRYFSEERALSPEGQSEFVSLDRLPFADREVFPLDEYAYHHFRGQRKHATVEWSRGCPFDCSFCPVSTRYKATWRKRSVESIVDEMTILRERHDVRSFYVEDEQPLADREWFFRVLESIRRRLPDIELLFPNGFWPTLMDEELVEVMAVSGVTRISLGVESADSAIRRRIGRTIDERHLKKLLVSLRKNGIESTGTFMLGFEGESELDRLATLRYAAMSSFDYVHFSVLWPCFPLVEELPAETAKLARLRSLGYAMGYVSPVRLARLMKGGDLSVRHLLTALKRYRAWNRAGSTGGGAW